MYIRTKDGVYENANPYFIEDNKLYMSWDYPTSIEADFLGDILNQSENLEELCDDFVLIERNAKPIIFKTLQGAINNKIYDDEIIYGAIWTDKGLIYVAKMNESGDLELI